MVVEANATYTWIASRTQNKTQSEKVNNANKEQTILELTSMEQGIISEAIENLKVALQAVGKHTLPKNDRALIS